MADKSFGVKELNLLNASGTPTITSPNNLNLNANNVAISTNVTIGGNLTVSNNIGISSLNVTGVSTFAGITTVSGDTLFTKQLSVSGVSTVNGISNFNGIVNIMSGLDLQTNGTLDIIGSSSSSGLDIQSNASVQIGQNGFPNNDYATFTNTGVNLKYNGSTKLATTNTGVTVTGTLAATAVTGDGSGLTGISAGISTSPSNVQATWKLGGGSGSGFTFTGPGQDGSEGNPNIYLVRGQRYLFDNTTLAGNHPFEFRNAANNADYTDGVSGAQNGLQYINVQHDAPAQLKYRCTIHTNSMLGNIYIVGGPQLGEDLDTNTKNIKFGDSASHGASGDDTLIFGADDDMRMYHDGSNGFISNNTGAFVIQDSHAGANAIVIRKGAEVEILHNNALACETSTNGLAFPNGKGIDFSAAGNTAGMTGELLNDYEEGTWTPEVKGTSGAGTASYNTQVGKYLKIGNWVYLTWVLGWSSGSAGGEMRTTGFPFTPATDCTGMGSVMFNNVSIHSNVSNIATYIGPGNDYCYFYTSRSSSGWITVNYSSSGNLIANVSFRTA